jgi:CelD/BcsL family acetyltransferase involved in cellulose biosynthesis
VELHQKRRESLGQRGCFASPRFTAFHRDVTAQLLSLGLLRLWWTDLDGRPAAIEYDLIGGDTIYFYQSGIEPELARDRPGWLGSIGSLRDAQRSGYRYFDFLRGDEAYKSSWRAVVLPADELRVVAPRTFPRLHYATWSTGQLLRRWAKLGRRKTPRPRANRPRSARVRP